jgi:hypothetical protein
MSKQMMKGLKKRDNMKITLQKFVEVALCIMKFVNGKP